MTPRLLYLLLLSSFSFHLKAQTSRTDSVRSVSKAKADAANFLLNDADLKQFRKHRDAYMSKQSSRPKPFSGFPLPPAPTLAMPGDLQKIHREYNQIDYYSNYFKPTPATTRDTSLLRDSVYVRTFRDAA